jgi:hypothetical protein
MVEEKQKRFLDTSGDVCTKKLKRSGELRTPPNEVLLEIFILMNRPTVLRLLNHYWESMTRRNDPLWKQLLSCMRVDSKFLESTVWIQNTEENTGINRCTWKIIYLKPNGHIALSFPYFLEQINSEKKVQARINKVVRAKRLALKNCGYYHDFKTLHIWRAVDNDYLTRWWGAWLGSTERRSDKVYFGPRKRFPGLYLLRDDRFMPRFVKKLTAECFLRFTPCLKGGDVFGEAVLTFMGRWSKSMVEASSQGTSEGQLEEEESEREGVENYCNGTRKGAFDVEETESEEETM